LTNRWLDDLTVSQETSLSLLARAQRGDAVALEALMGRYLTRLQRWATGRVPAGARSLLDTDDVVQDALLNTFRRLDQFQLTPEPEVGIDALRSRLDMPDLSRGEGLAGNFSISFNRNK
jgi:hypothetical protein